MSRTLGANEQGVPENVLVEDEEDDLWRKGDGGSSPGFRAIFLATVSHHRLTTDD
jgi:hypothetical protein